VVYEVAVSLQSFVRLPAEGERVWLDVVTHLREDALVLFGFLDREEKEMFGLLRTVSGVGPRLALNVLSGIPARDLRGALAGGDVDRLCRVPGWGRRPPSAWCSSCASAAVKPRRNRGPQRARAARARAMPRRSRPGHLGYKRGEAERVLEGIGPEVRLEDAIREALRRFAR
jgi:Holliday junction DNA helicase RuvA